LIEGDVILTPVPQADGQIKNRPALILREMPPFGDMLVCGISTQLQQEVVGFDEVISVTDPEFADSGLRATSLIRLGFLSILPANRIIGTIGTVSSSRHRRLLENLCDHLLA
jgi:mRNA interferase MazF